ncbi:MAG: hypothetical protein CM1200mP34_0090 [Verrucomicrobiales bacterium]|nr:MAG: hypothetical protein CM1200mP34_0090 [Verrucomicrobiales bacterium]
MQWIRLLRLDGRIPSLKRFLSPAPYRLSGPRARLNCGSGAPVMEMGGSGRILGLCGRVMRKAVFRLSAILRMYCVASAISPAESFPRGLGQFQDGAVYIARLGFASGHQDDVGLFKPGTIRTSVPP